MHIFKQTLLVAALGLLAVHSQRREFQDTYQTLLDRDALPYDDGNHNYYARDYGLTERDLFYANTLPRYEARGLSSSSYQEYLAARSLLRRSPKTPSSGGSRSIASYKACKAKVRRKPASGRPSSGKPAPGGKNRRSVLIKRTPSGNLNDKTALRVDQGTESDPGEAAFLDFTTGIGSDGKKYATKQIGTDSLCGCLAVIIASPKGAAVGHFLPGDAAEMSRMMSRKFMPVYNSHHEKLAGGKAYLVEEQSNGKSTSSEAMVELVKHLTALGFPPQMLGYDATDPEDVSKLDDGTAVVDGTTNPPTIYVGDRKKA